MEFIRRNIIRDHQFDIKELELGKKIQKIEVPVMLIASTHDTFVSFNHATELYKCASSKYKVLEYIDK
jgi:alpha-beta hydrolase superfamily lysophospholipase